jgi:uroporphyrinogen decarboxylase
MTSRERVLASLNHQRPDRVPVDFGAHRSSGIMAIAYHRLRQHLGLPARPVRVYDVVQQLAIIDADVLDRFGIDTIELGRGFNQADRDWKEWTLPDGTPCLVPAWVDLRRDGGDWIMRQAGRDIAVQKEGSLYFEQIHWPYLDAVPDDLSGLPEVMPHVLWTVPAPPSPGSDLQAGAQALRQSTSRAIVGLFGGNLLEWMQFLCRNDNCFMLLAGEPEQAHALLDRLVEIHLANLERYLAAVGPSLDIVLFGDDLGMQTGPQISPAMYRTFFKPREAVMWKRAKTLCPHLRVMLHCCGGVRELLDDLIDAGLDAINPVQITCRGMEAAGLKRDFGSRLTFWGGGCDTREVLPGGTPEEVRAHVLQQLSLWAPDHDASGFVFQQVHNIMADVPPQNVVAMFDAIAEYNRRETVASR